MLDATRTLKVETADRQGARWTAALTFGIALILYFAIVLSDALSRSAVTLVNDVAWTLAGFATAVICFNVARQLHGRERRAWAFIAVGALCWFFGQAVWDYYDLVVGKLPLFPHWVQLLFLSYPVCITLGLCTLPKPQNATGMTLRHFGNLGLIVCTLAVALTVAFMEPAARSERSLASLALMLAHGVMYAIACMTALYLLWSYSWQTAYWPLILVALGTGVQSIAFIADAHSRMAGTYAPSDWVNGAWILALACVACAAYEFAWVTRRGEPKLPDAMLRRERVLEAALPAGLLLAVAFTAIGSAEWISTRVIYVVAGIGAIFALILGVREAWIQRETQRLLAALNSTNQSLLDSNQHLSDSEQRYRHLNQQLEQRVAERTQNLQRAYEELESFSYAVAHDLKAPLRAMDGFGALLDQEYGKGLDDQARGYIARMRHGAITMAHLVDDLLAYARIDRRESHVLPTELATAVRNCIDEHREELDHAHASLTLDIPQLSLSIDCEGLEIALRNVLQNAIKFSAQATTPNLQLQARCADSKLLLAVSDNGIGFDMEYHDRIFQMFQRLHRADAYPGTGIGLAIARKAVERAGGRIWARSAPGEGATFFIELPVREVARS